jgi:hypothetical protein
MKRLSILFLASFAVIALFFVASAFTKSNVEKQTVYEYLQFTGATYSETHFENDANWSSLGTTEPSTNPCIDGTAKTCVLKIDQALITNDPSKSLEEELDDYLTGLPSATTFVNSNYSYRKP